MKNGNEPGTEPRTWRARLTPVLRIGAILLAALIVLAFLQDRLLHYPEQLTPSQALVQAKVAGLVPWPSGEDARGWLRDPPNARGTVILFHGNGGHALHRQWFAETMAEHGFRTILAEYPGYGHRDGAFDEKVLAADAAVSIGIARARQTGPLIVAGESLGAGVAGSALARSSAKVDGLLLVTPWDTLSNIAGHHYPWLPVRLLLRDRYDSVANLHAVPGPKAVVIAEDDLIIPKQFGLALHDSLAEPRRLLRLPGVGHNDWMDAMTPGRWQELLAFLAP